MTKFRLISLLSIAALCLAGFALVRSDEACADSWLMPERETILSANGQYRFTVEPADIGSQLDYFSQEVEAERTGTPVARSAPLGLLERRTEGGKWEPVWAAALANRVAPVTVLVADDGRHVVTLDNWHGIGHGEDVIVIYGQDGKLIRSMALTDLVPADYVEALPHSVSSVSWRKDVAISSGNDRLTIEVLIPGQDRLEQDPETLAFVITLANGAVQPPPEKYWRRAQCAADRVNLELAKAEKARIAYLTEPLTPPKGCEERDWHNYLREAHARISDQPRFEASTSTTVLFARDHARHGESVEWLHNAVARQTSSTSNASFASPCDPDGLVEAFGKAVKRVKPGTASKATFYIAAPEAQFAAIARLLAPTGAEAVWLDPAVAIPQRPDRIPGSPEQRAAQLAEDEEFAALLEEAAGE